MGVEDPRGDHIGPNNEGEEEEKIDDVLAPNNLLLPIGNDPKKVRGRRGSKRFRIESASSLMTIGECATPNSKGKKKGKKKKGNMMVRRKTNNLLPSVSDP